MTTPTKTTGHLGENSPEQVAFNLLEVISNNEKKELYAQGASPADRKWVLETYSDCLAAVKAKLPAAIY